MAHACNPSTWEAEAKVSEVQGHPWLPEYKLSLGYIIPYPPKILRYTVLCIIYILDNFFKKKLIIKAFKKTNTILLACLNVAQ